MATSGAVRPQDTDHVSISHNAPATRLVLNALDPAHAQRPTC
ncbi:hypothetical protein OG331_44115 [Streptomyces sp. NBC_01017]|nr:hypothetical protein OG331_44115 [Streptomyces sp. NBC_01017]